MPIAVGILSAIKKPESYLKMPGVQSFGKYVDCNAFGPMSVGTRKK
jgi:hypothetical protein